jgi:hypothetical protein
MNFLPIMHDRGGLEGLTRAFGRRFNRHGRHALGTPVLPPDIESFDQGDQADPMVRQQGVGDQSGVGLCLARRRPITGRDRRLAPARPAGSDCGHRMDEPSKGVLVPANRFEVLECRKRDMAARNTRKVIPRPATRANGSLSTSLIEIRAELRRARAKLSSLQSSTGLSSMTDNGAERISLGFYAIVLLGGRPVSASP